MKQAAHLKKPYGKSSFSRIKHARFLGWEDAFDVEFEDGLCFLEPQAVVRKANGSLPRPSPCAWKWTKNWAVTSK